MTLSIIVPVYNVSAYVTATIQSLARQTSSDFEVVVVDDGSTDDSVARVRSAIPPDGAWRLIRQQNQGVAAARNVGFRAAIGEYVLFLDGDDQVSPDLVDAIRGASSTSPDVIVWQYREVSPSEASVATPERNYAGVEISGPAAFERIVRSGDLSVWTGSIAYRRSFLLQSALYHTVGCVSGEDREFLYRAVARACRVVVLRSELSYWIQRPDSVTKSNNLRRFDAVEALERAFKDLSKLPDQFVREVVRDVEKSTVMGHFFFNLNSCITIDWRASSSIFEQIDHLYPGLIDRVRQNLEQEDRIGSSRRLYLRSKNAYRYYIHVRDWAYRSARTPYRFMLRRRGRKSPTCPGSRQANGV